MPTYEGPYPAFASASASRNPGSTDVVADALDDAAQSDDSYSADNEFEHARSIEPEYPERVNNGCQIYKSNCDHDWSIRRIGGWQCSKCNVFIEVSDAK